jgi:hypothetical protein
MKNINLVVIISILAISLGALAVLSAKSQENFKTCVCSSREGGREQNCQDNDKVQKLYNDNILTEYSVLKNPGWSDTGPGSYCFPKSNCSCDNCKERIEHPKYSFWDFSQFGNSGC